MVNIERPRTPRSGIADTTDLPQKSPHRYRGVVSKAAEIPVIDISGFDDRTNGATPDAIVGQVAAAAERFGFFQVVGHGIAPGVIEEVWAQSRRFFSLARDDKRAVARTRDNARGYYDRELTKRARDLKEVFDFAHVPHPELDDADPRNFAAVDGHNQWPEAIPEFRTIMRRYLAECETVAHRLLHAFALGLGLEPTFFDRHFDRDHTSFIRLNWYPLADPLDSEEATAVTSLGDMALHHHTDAGALTLLLQDDVGGLQVSHDGSWIDVDPLDGGLVVNTGDMMQVWSNDRYRAALHRVRPMRGVERGSIPYFFNPSYRTEYLPVVTGPESPPRYRPINWGAFRQGRADGDYADYGTEIQIDHFRV